MFPHHGFIKSLLTSALVMVATTATAQIDSLVVLVDSATATGSKPLAAFGYNPVDNSMFVSAFGAGAELRKISDIDGTPTYETYVTETELQLYYRDGDPNRGVLTPFQSAIQLNPQPITIGETTLPAYSFAVINDNGTTRLPGTTTIDPTATKRFYQYNLQPVDFEAGEDGRDVFTTLTTLSDMQAALGVTGTTSNQGRQGAWSGDGQILYFADSSTIFGGIWKLDPITGDIEQLLDGNGDTNIEPAVRTSGGVDTIYISGASGVNAGGIDSFTYDGTTVGERTIAVSEAALQDFLELSGTAVADVRSMTTDPAGNIYFNQNDGTPERRGIYRLDTEGRLSKVVSHAERDIAFTNDGLGGTNPNSNTLRMQTRTVDHSTAGNITQIMYAEPSSLNLVAGLYAFEPGDFDRDGELLANDLALFGAALTVRGQAITDVSQYKFDLNGNSVVDWKDVKILQQFAGLANGDVNFDGLLDFTDLDTLDANYHTTGASGLATWIDGDITSFVANYPVTAFDANTVNFADLSLLADTWLNVLQQGIEELDLTSRYAGQFLTDALVAFGFEAATLLGDYNGDGAVDAADYTVWRNSLEATGSNLTADGYADGVVDEQDYLLWKTMYGNTIPANTAALQTVPEPTSLVLLGCAVAGALWYGRRRNSID